VVLADGLAQRGKVRHIVALDLAAALIYLALRLIPVVIGLTFRRPCLLPERIGALADFVFAFVGHGRAPIPVPDKRTALQNVPCLRSPGAANKHGFSSVSRTDAGFVGGQY